MSNFKVNGHPKPKADESFRGYLLRLVDLNGFKSIRVFKNKLQFFRFNFTLFASRDSVEYFISKLAPSLHTTPDELASNFFLHWTWDIHQSNREHLQGLFNVSCRICPLCVKENGYYRADWEFSLTTFCHKHSCYLIDECPNCKKSGNWHGGSLSKCYNCEEVYSDYPVELLHKDNPLLELAKLVNKHQQHAIEKIVVICNRVNRLGDNNLASLHINKMPIAKVIILLTKVSCFLHSKRYRDGYIDWLKATRQEYQYISEQAVLEPYLALIDIFPCQDLVNTLDLPFIPPTDTNKIKQSDIDRAIKVADHYGVSPARLSNVEPTVKVINLKEQINGKRLAQLLSLPMSSIEKLVKNNGLIPSNNIERLHRYYYYLSDINELLTPVPLSHIKSSKRITLKDFIATDKFNSFAMPYSSLIELVIRKKITLYENTEMNGFMNQFIDEQEAFQALHKEIPIQSQNKTTTDLATIFQTTVENIMGLYEQGYIDIDNFWKMNQSPDHIINSDTFEAITKKYVSLNRLCYFSGECLEETKEKLQQQNITPAIIINESQKKLYLYSSLRKYA